MGPPGTPMRTFCEGTEAVEGVVAAVPNSVKRIIGKEDNFGSLTQVSTIPPHKNG
jgi:hypothetical protein